MRRNLHEKTHHGVCLKSQIFIRRACAATTTSARTRVDTRLDERHLLPGIRDLHTRRP